MMCIVKFCGTGTFKISCLSLSEYVSLLFFNFLILMLDAQFRKYTADAADDD